MPCPPSRLSADSHGTPSDELRPSHTQIVRRNKDPTKSTGSKMAFASRGLRVKQSTQVSAVPGMVSREDRGQRMHALSGKQQKGEAISWSARSEAGARQRRQTHLMCYDQVPRQHDHQREDQARCACPSAQTRRHTVNVCDNVQGGGLGMHMRRCDRALSKLPACPGRFVQV